MGDALMQVLDIAEKIQAEDAARRRTRRRRPPATAAPAASAAAGRPERCRPTSRPTSRSSPRSCCPTAPTPSARPSRSTRRIAPRRSACRSTRSRSGPRTGPSRSATTSARCRPSMSRRTPRRSQQIADTTGGDGVRRPDRRGPEVRLRQPPVARRLHRAAPGSHLRARRRRAAARRRRCRAVRGLVRPAPVAPSRPTSPFVRRLEPTAGDRADAAFHSSQDCESARSGLAKPRVGRICGRIRRFDRPLTRPVNERDGQRSCATLAGHGHARSPDARVRCRRPAGRVPGPRPRAGRPPRRLPRRAGRHAGPAAGDRRGRRLLPRHRTPTRAARSRPARLSDAIVDEAHAAVADFLGAGRPGRDQVRPEHVEPDAPPRAVDRGDARAGRRDRRDDARPRGERQHVAGDGRRPRRDRPDRRHRPDRRDPRPRGPRIEALVADEARRRRLCQQRGRDGQPGPRDRRPRPRGRRADLSSTRWRSRRTARSTSAALDTDFLVCSAYKWFGPHLGALYGKAEVLDRPAGVQGPARRTIAARPGRPSFESIAGTLAATDYLRDVGRDYGDVAGAPGAANASERRRELVAGMVGHRRLRARARRAASSTASRPSRASRSTASPTRRGSRRACRRCRVSIAGVHPRAAAEALARGRSTPGTATSTRPG